MLNFRVLRERESRVELRDVIIGLDLAAAAEVDKACAIKIFTDLTFYLCNCPEVGHFAQAYYVISFETLTLLSNCLS